MTSFPRDDTEKIRKKYRDKFKKNQKERAFKNIYIINQEIFRIYKNKIFKARHRMNNLRSNEAQFILWDFFKFSSIPLTFLGVIINLAKEFLKSSSLGIRNTTIIICSFLAIYIAGFGIMIFWKIRQNVRDRKDKRDLITEEIAMRAETRQLRQNETQGRSDVFKAARNYNDKGVSINQDQMKEFGTYFSNIQRIVDEKNETSQILVQMDALNDTLNDQTEVPRDFTFETKAPNRDRFNFSEVSKTAKRPFKRAFSSISRAF